MNPQQAVAIAKDVLERLPFLNAQRGVYLQSMSFALEEDSDLTLVGMLNQENTCTVCALGACFLSFIMLDKDAFSHSLFKLHKGALGDDLFEWHGGKNYTFCPSKKLIKDYLRDVFGEENICLMETAFETNRFLHHYEYKCNKAHIQNAYDFGRRFSDDPKDRLKAIMQNIITNNGHFIPGEKT